MHFPTERHRRFIRAAGIVAFVCGSAGLLLLFPYLAMAHITANHVLATTTASRPAVQKMTSVVTTQVVTPTHTAGDLVCRLCHEDTSSVLTFPSGEELNVQVDLEALAASAHGLATASPLACFDCHRPVNDYQFPHAPVAAANLRAYHVERAQTCETCHVDPHLTSHPGPGSETPVVCTDCHGAHDVLTVAEWQSGEGTDTCVDCHTASGIILTDPQQLTALIQDNLFAERVNNEYCLSCHSQPDLTLVFPNGDALSLAVDESDFNHSVHGIENPWQPLQCSDCHKNYEFPHQPVTAASAREYTLEKYTICAECHEPKYEDALDSVHAIALAEGNLEAAVCTDCHGAHDTPPPDEPRQRIAFTCAQCHGTIFEEYADSVHGEPLLAENNADVPTCIECHGVHNINDPTTALFRIRSPQLCATCHADPELMEQYGISTEVFETYVADFHGTTVTLFEHQDPTVETNKAVCYDCHGVHNIGDPDDPQAGIKANLLKTCRQCHPDASTNFPDAWTSHFRPSLDHHPLVYLVELFYAIFIPATVGFFGLLVMTDVYRRTRLRWRKPAEDDQAVEGPTEEREATVDEVLADDDVETSSAGDSPGGGPPGGGDE
ncbi:MAG TPA: cytochrome c3 family protein [Anaerolineae bacterium]